MFMAPAVSPSLGMLVATAELFRESITRGDGWGLSLVLRFLLLCCPLHGEKKKKPCTYWAYLRAVTVQRCTHKLGFGLCFPWPAVSTHCWESDGTEWL